MEPRRLLVTTTTSINLFLSPSHVPSSDVTQSCALLHLTGWASRASHNPPHTPPALEIDPIGSLTIPVSSLSHGQPVESSFLLRVKNRFVIFFCFPSFCWDFREGERVGKELRLG